MRGLQLIALPSFGIRNLLFVKLFHALPRSFFCLLPICKHLRHLFFSRNNVRLLSITPGLLSGVLPVKRNKTIDSLGIGKGLHRAIAECDLNMRRCEGCHRTLPKADVRDTLSNQS